MILTLASIKQSNIPKVLNLCPDDPRLLQFVNEAQERLMSTAKDWVGTWQSARFVISGGCITWPRGVLEIRQAKICGTPMLLRNSWYEYVQPVGEPNDAKRTGDFLVLQEYDQSPVHANVALTGNTIRFFPGTASDVGKRILVQGYNANNVFVRSQDTDGTWVDGEYVTLESPFTDTVNTWYENGITGIQKDLTDQPVTMFDVNALDGDTSEMASFDPDDYYPSFKRSKIFDRVRRLVTGSCCTFQMECIVKRAHIPVRIDTDYLVLQNLAAFKDACQGVKRDEDEGPGAGLPFMRSAEKLLTGQLQNVLGRLVHIEADFHGGRTFYRGVMRGMR